MLEKQPPSIANWDDQHRRTAKYKNLLFFQNDVNIWEHGDLVRSNSFGEFQIIGRSDNVIKRRGIKLGPDEISLELMNQFGLHHFASAFLTAKKKLA